MTEFSTDSGPRRGGRSWLLGCGLIAALVIIGGGGFLIWSFVGAFENDPVKIRANLAAELQGAEVPELLVPRVQFSIPWVGGTVYQFSESLRGDDPSGIVFIFASLPFDAAEREEMRAAGEETNPIQDDGEIKVLEPRTFTLRGKELPAEMVEVTRRKPDEPTVTYLRAKLEITLPSGKEGLMLFQCEKDAPRFELFQGILDSIK